MVYSGQTSTPTGDIVMPMCEDWPACGHEHGCCPDFDESGRQLNMRCVCGAVLPINSYSSLCRACLNGGGSFGDGYDYFDRM